MLQSRSFDPNHPEAGRIRSHLTASIKQQNIANMSGIEIMSRATAILFFVLFFVLVAEFAYGEAEVAEMVRESRKAFPQYFLDWAAKLKPVLQAVNAMP